MGRTLLLIGRPGIGKTTVIQAVVERLAGQAGRPLRVPPLFLCTDNAAMVAACGHFRFVAGQRDGWAMDVRPTWPLA